MRHEIRRSPRAGQRLPVRAFGIVVLMTIIPLPSHAQALVSPAAIHFGEVPMNTCAARTFTVTNDDSAPLLIGNPVLSGSPGFSVVPPPTFSSSVPLAPGGSVTFTAYYDAQALGSHFATVTIPYHAGDDTGTNTVTLAATTSNAWGPLLFVHVPAYDFGNVPLGTVVHGRLLVRNEGALPIPLRFAVDRSFTGSDAFQVILLHGGEFTAGPGETKTVALVHYRPRTLGLHVVAVTWFWDTCRGTREIDIGFRGVGVP